MDAFALKKDNRKRFQDKQRSKSKHATPSDRKYRILNKEKEQKEKEEEEEPIQLPSNAERYEGEEILDIIGGNDDEITAKSNSMLKEIIKSRANEPILQTFDTNQSITNKKINDMSVGQLNEFLKKSAPSSVLYNESSSKIDVKLPNEAQNERKKLDCDSEQLKKLKPVSKVPQILANDQEFLDGLL